MVLNVTKKGFLQSTLESTEKGASASMALTKISDSITNKEINTSELITHLLNCLGDHYIKTDAYKRYETNLDKIDLKNSFHNGKEISDAGIALLTTFILDKYNSYNQNKVTDLNKRNFNELLNFSLPHFLPRDKHTEINNIKSKIMNAYNNKYLDIKYSIFTDSYNVQIDDNVIEFKMDNNAPTDIINEVLIEQFVECVKSDVIDPIKFINKCIDFLVNPHPNTAQFLLIYNDTLQNTDNATDKLLRIEIFNGKSLTNFSAVVLFCLLTIMHYKENPNLEDTISSINDSRLDKHLVDKQLKKFLPLDLFTNKKDFNNIRKKFAELLDNISYKISYKPVEGLFYLRQKNGEQLDFLDIFCTYKDTLEEKFENISNNKIVKDMHIEDERSLNGKRAKALFTRALPLIFPSKPVPLPQDKNVTKD